MAEFGMRNSHSTASLSGQGASVPTGGMEWYNPSVSQPGQPQGWVGSTAYTGSTYPAPSAHNPYASGPSHGFAGPGPSAGAYTSFDDEPPLLEELGIDIGGILRKARAVLLHRLNSHLTEELDMGGALVFVLLLGGLHLLLGKLHFGIILGWSVVHAALLWFLVNQLAGVDAAEAKGLDLYSVCCVVGYCQAPLAVHSAATLLLPRGLASSALGVLCTLWAAFTASKIMARRCLALSDQRSLLTFPCLLLFASFAMLTGY